MKEFITLFSDHIVAISSALVTAALGAHLVWRNNRKNRHAIACSKFRADVISALSGLYPISTNWPTSKLTISTLEDRFQSLQAAITEFRPNVAWYKKPCFDRAWRVYRLGKEGREIDGQYYWQYVPHSGEGIEQSRHYKHDNTRTYKDDFKKNVDRLLSYAKST